MTANSAPTPTVKIHARHVTLKPEWLEDVQERTLQLDRFGNNILAFDIEVSHSSNRSRQDTGWRVDIASLLNRHTIRASAEADDPRRAFELARDVMEANLRRAARRQHWSRHGRKAVLKIRTELA